MSKPCKYGSRCDKLAGGICTFFHSLDELSSKRARTDDMNYHNQFYEDKIADIERIHQSKIDEYKHIHQKTHDVLTKEIKNLKRKLKNSEQDYIYLKTRFTKEHQLCEEKNNELNFVKSLLFEKFEYITPVKDDGKKLSFESV